MHFESLGRPLGVNSPDVPPQREQDAPGEEKGSGREPYLNNFTEMIVNFLRECTWNES
jgi:hypothetical protein